MDKTQQLINRILEVDNFQNMASFCSNWQEFTQELEEWGVYSAAKIDFDDKELDLNLLNNFILKDKYLDDWVTSLTPEDKEIVATNSQRNYLSKLTNSEVIEELDWFFGSELMSIIQTIKGGN